MLRTSAPREVERQRSPEAASRSAASWPSVVLVARPLGLAAILVERTASPAVSHRSVVGGVRGRE